MAIESIILSIGYVIGCGNMANNADPKGRKYYVARLLGRAVGIRLVTAPWRTVP